MEDLIKSNIKIIKDTIKEKSLGALKSKISMNLLSYLITQNQDINYYQDVNHFLVMAILNKIFYYLSIGDFIRIFQAKNEIQLYKEKTTNRILIDENKNNNVQLGIYMDEVKNIINIDINKKITLQKNAENIFITCHHQTKNLIYKNENFSLTHYDKFVEIKTGKNNIDPKNMIGITHKKLNKLKKNQKNIEEKDDKSINKIDLKLFITKNYSFTLNNKKF